MAVDDPKPHSEPKVWNFFKLPFRHSSSASGTTSSAANLPHHHHHHNPNTHNPPLEGSTSQASNSVSSVARSLIPTRRRLKLDPSNKLYFPYEPGKQVRSAIRIKNTSKSQVAFKFQTTAPKSCFMRPPGAILAPGESIIATVFKFVEQPENNEKPDKTGLKFKIMSLKVKGSIDYVPELFDELKDQVAVEQILRVVFLDPERPSPDLTNRSYEPRSYAPMIPSRSYVGSRSCLPWMLPLKHVRNLQKMWVLKLLGKGLS